MNRTSALKNRIYLSRCISALGSWLTFLALTLMVNDKYGSSQVAYMLLIQSLPPLLLAKFVREQLSRVHPLRAFVVLSVISGINVCLLTIDTSLIHLYIYFIISSLVATATTPLFFFLLGEWVDRDQFEEVHTRVSTINPFILAIAPPMGGVLASVFGSHILFIVSGLLQLGAALILPSLTRNSNSSLSAPVTEHHVSSELAFDRKFLFSLFTWYSFLIVGAIFNALEFAVLKLNAFSSAQTGFIFGAWGLGHLLIFFGAKKVSKLLSAGVWATILVSGFSIFLFGHGFAEALAGLMIAGLANATLSGQLRANVHHTIPSNFTAISVWTLINGRSALINIVCYGGLGYFVSQARIFSLNWIFVIFGLLFITMVSHSLPRFFRASKPENK